MKPTRIIKESLRDLEEILNLPHCSLKGEGWYSVNWDAKLQVILVTKTNIGPRFGSTVYSAAVFKEDPRPAVAKAWGLTLFSETSQITYRIE